jgi:transcriptional regulator with XRE-family HTH domain
MESIVTQRPDQIRAVFGANLSELVKRERSVAEFARRLGLNRTQVLRFLEGTAFPRPDVLAAICGYFGVDARILTEPLAKIDAEAKVSGSEVDPFLADLFGPVAPEVLPDGLYSEWSNSNIRPGQIVHVIVQFFRRDGACYMRHKSHDPVLLQTTSKARYSLPFRTRLGRVIPQRGGFAVFERVMGQAQVCFSAYTAGYWSHEDIYPGYQLWGHSYAPKLQHTHCGSVLQRIPRSTSAYLAAARLPLYRDKAQTPEVVRAALARLNSECLSYHLPDLAAHLAV